MRWAAVAEYIKDVSRTAAALSKSPVVIGHSLGGLAVQKYLETGTAPAAVLLAPSAVSSTAVYGGLSYSQPAQALLDARSGSDLSFFAEHE